MKLFNWLKSIVLLSSILFLLSACTAAPAATVVPTVDEAKIVEMAVSTVEAKLTANAPTAVPTEAPTAILAATATSTEVLEPSATPEPTATDKPKYSNQAEWVYTSTFPENRREFRPNEIFNIAWGLKNVGTIDWTADYKLVWVSGDHFTDVTEIPLGKGVKPGETCQFSLGAFGSEDMSQHTTNWQLVDQSGYPVPGGFVSFTYQPI